MFLLCRLALDSNCHLLNPDITRAIGALLDVASEDDFPAVVFATFPYLIVQAEGVMATLPSVSTNIRNLAYVTDMVACSGRGRLVGTCFRKFTSQQNAAIPCYHHAAESGAISATRSGDLY